MQKNEVKAIAVYLPQFHPIPENDEWWGKGFTEWTNVAKARPLFKDHWQPRLPADLGFYDLRVPEVREAQAQLAKEYGIYGFCYWHYWFAGKRILERPFAEVVENGKPDFPFCVAWAKQTWEGKWHGLSNDKILIKQTYPGKNDYIAHFYSLLPAFQDKRYIEVKGKKVVFIFRPMDITDPKKFIDIWQNLSIKEGLKGIHFVGMHMSKEWNPEEAGYDAMVQSWINRDQYEKFSSKEIWSRRYLHPRIRRLIESKTKLPKVISYDEYVANYPEHPLKKNEYPWIYTDWDNTPRCGTDGWLFDGATPEKFGELCVRAFKSPENTPPEERFVILRSWNEWAEGNYLEPDNRYGTDYLEQFQKSLKTYSNIQVDNIQKLSSD
jgi:hypothetical protein